MAIYASQHPGVKDMQGLHLYHFALSNCSQRVRLGLEEKGEVVIESNDILVYLDEHFPEPPLRPADAAGRLRMEEHIAASSAAQGSFKTLSHELLFRRFRVIGSEELALYEARARDRELVAFLRDYAAEGPAFDRAVVSYRP